MDAIPIPNTGLSRLEIHKSAFGLAGSFFTAFTFLFLTVGSLLLAFDAGMLWTLPLGLLFGFFSLRQITQTWLVASRPNPALTLEERGVSLNFANSFLSYGHISKVYSTPTSLLVFVFSEKVDVGFSSFPVFGRTKRKYLILDSLYRESAKTIAAEVNRRRSIGLLSGKANREDLSICD